MAVDCLSYGTSANASDGDIRPARIAGGVAARMQTPVITAAQAVIKKGFHSETPKIIELSVVLATARIAIPNAMPQPE